MVIFIDRMGNSEQLAAHPSEAIRDVLIRNRIPPASVITLVAGQPVPDTARIDPSLTYESRLIEGYDVQTIRDLMTNEHSVVANPSIVYVKDVVTFTKKGGLGKESDDFSLEKISRHVETTVIDTCKEFELNQS